MQVLTGPPGSGKTSYVLDQVRASLGRRISITLVVPTTTMAEHFRNQLAREGFVFRPSAIVTFSKFIDLLVPDLPQVSPAAMELIVAGALDSLSLPMFAAVKGYAGFRRCVVDQIEELTSAGIDAPLLHRAGVENSVLDDFVQLYACVETEVARRGLYLRSQRLAEAARRIAEQNRAPTIIHGFFSFTRQELDILAALGRSGELLVTLPSWEGSEASHRAMLKCGAEEIPHPDCQAPGITRILTAAPTADQEAEEIARRIVEQTKNGREFREIGVVVRSDGPFVPVLRCALERFGIPARFYFGKPLKDCSAIAFLMAVVDSMLGGWEHQETVAALRRSGSPIALDSISDTFEFAVRRRLPNHGLAALREIAAGKYEHVFEVLQSIEGWRTCTATCDEWATRFRQVTKLFAAPPIKDAVSQRDIEAWRAQSAGLAGFEAAVDELAALLDPAEVVGCAEYWSKLRTVIEANTLRVPDNRRNVVHVIDAYEARQWKLPVVFLCGLLEKQFPKHHSESPLLPDSVRLLLRPSGIHLRTKSDRHEEEQFLFDLATSRATSTLVLSYPLLNAKGDATLPSFFIERMRQRVLLREEKTLRCRPEPGHAVRYASPSGIFAESLRARLKTRFVSFTPTAIETFLQCPYQFFAGQILKLQTTPPDPSDRLDALVQGNIAHDALHVMYRDGITLAQAFEMAWADRCGKARVLPGYRSEAVKLELFRNIETFVKSVLLPPTPNSEFERNVAMQLPDGTEIRGRIDRLDIDALGQSLIIDYKYKRGDAIKDVVKAHDEGTLVQGGLYLMATRSNGYETAGMVYAGFRREASVTGWIANGAFHHLDQSCSPEKLNEVVRKAIEVSMRSVNEIHDGRIAPAPADKLKCKYCAYANACRVEVAARTISKGVSQ